jgi:hypothetical protein
MKNLLITLVFCNLLFCAYAKYSGGTGEPNDPYRIATPEDLNAIGDNSSDWDKHFLMTADVNMVGYSYTTALIAPYTSSSPGFQRIAFSGAFDGSDHTIFSLVMNGGSSDCVGLFGNLAHGSNVKNLKIENIIVNGGGTLGGLCGLNQGGNISGCYVTGSVTNSDSRYIAGGLCGANASGGIIDKCYVVCSVNGGNFTLALGGLCGDNSDATITNCYAASSVTAGSHSGILGGLCGKNRGVISNSFSTGSVTGADDSAQLGGLCGRNDGEVSNCYSTESLTCGLGSTRVGGLCGWNFEGMITNCYSTGSVGGSSDEAGGLCGFSNNPSSIHSSYFLEASGPDNGLGEPLTTEQMKLKTSFVDWDFDTPIWEICTETVDYPHLWWERYCNTTPVAVAGPNQTAYASIDGLADVTLDGSASYDDDNDVLSYYWSWTIDGNVFEANGVSPTIQLPVGEHQIELIVDDGIDESLPDYCIINVISPMDMLLDLSDYIDQLNLPAGTANSLKAKLDATMKNLNDNNGQNDKAAANVLGAFINAVEAQQGKKIPTSDADDLIAAAQDIIESMNNN